MKLISGYTGATLQAAHDGRHIWAKTSSTRNLTQNRRDPSQVRVRLTQASHLTQVRSESGQKKRKMWVTKWDSPPSSSSIDSLKHMPWSGSGWHGSPTGSRHTNQVQKYFGSLNGAIPPPTKNMKAQNSCHGTVADGIHP